MKLDWDKNIMIKCRDILLKKDNLTQDDIDIINFYNSFLNKESIDEEENFSFLSNIELLQKLEEKKAEYKIFINSLPHKIRNNLYTLIDSCKSNYYNDDDKINYLSKEKVNNKDLFNTSYEVFESISPYFNECLSYIYKNNLVKITKGYGRPYCITDCYNKKGFVLLKRSCENTTESSYNHELAHSIIALLNGEFFYNKEDFLAEFHSSFMQFYTDLFLYKKTYDYKYLISYENYLIFIKTYLLTFAIIDELSNIKGNLNITKIENQFLKTFNIRLYDFNFYFNNFLNDYNGKENYTYLLSGFCSLNLINNNDIEEVKRTFTDSSFNNFLTKEEFFKAIDFNIDSDYYMLDILNKSINNTTSLVRKK